MDKLIETLPLIIALVVPPLFALVRGYVTRVVPDRFIPVFLPIAGGVVAGIASLFGVDASALSQASSDSGVWQTVITGILTGSAAVGIHQIKRQADKGAS